VLALEFEFEVVLLNLKVGELGGVERGEDVVDDAIVNFAGAGREGPCELATGPNTSTNE